jgi:hypothetical protein
LDAQRGQRSANNLVEWDGDCLTFSNSVGKSLAFAAMTFVLTPTSTHYLLLPMANKFEAAEIIEYGDCAAAKHFDALLRK